MKRFFRLLPPIFAILMFFVGVPLALAHPLGNFTTNHYAGLMIRTESIEIDYVLDMAEIPAFQEIAAFDANQNQQPDPEETLGYPERKCQELSNHLELRVQNQPTSLKVTSSEVSFPPGVGELPTLRLTCHFQSSASTEDLPYSMEFLDESYPDRLGWREIVVIPEEVALQGDYTTKSISQRLTAYPDDLLETPLDQRQLSLTIYPVGAAVPQEMNMSEVSTSPTLPGRTLPGREEDAFTRLITLQELTPATMSLALGIALVMGAAHALTPGHGKTVVAAYLVGTRGTVKHAIFLGLTTTITHTTGVFILGLITLFASKYILPEQLFPWLTVLSGLFVVGIGINLFLSRIRSALKLKKHSIPSHHTHDHDNDHNHNHDHHAHDHHQHDHPHHHHDHEHPHPHSHLPPGADGNTVTWRDLLALGISGGLLPCPSALIVLLSAISLGRVAFGLVLVTVFSLGLAGLLTAIGLFFVYTGRFISDRGWVNGPILRIMPVVSALIITVIGLGLLGKALQEIGLGNYLF